VAPVFLGVFLFYIAAEVLKAMMPLRDPIGFCEGFFLEQDLHILEAEDA